MAAQKILFCSGKPYKNENNNKPKQKKTFGQADGVGRPKTLPLKGILGHHFQKYQSVVKWSLLEKVPIHKWYWKDICPVKINITIVLSSMCLVFSKISTYIDKIILHLAPMLLISFFFHTKKKDFLLLYRSCYEISIFL